MGFKRWIKFIGLNCFFIGTVFAYQFSSSLFVQRISFVSFWGFIALHFLLGICFLIIDAIGNVPPKLKQQLIEKKSKTLKTIIVLFDVVFLFLLIGFGWWTTSVFYVVGVLFYNLAKLIYKNNLKNETY